MCVCRVCGCDDPDGVGCYCEHLVTCELCADEALDDELELDEAELDAALNAELDATELELEDPDAWKNDATGTP